MPFEGFPHVIGWELTLGCNLRCRHCASSAGAGRPQELTLEESLGICEQFPELLVCQVVFTGGEPFLNPGWATIAAKLRDLGIKSGIVTNGLMVTDRLAERMQECGLTAAGVSLDGPEAVHDDIRHAQGVFKKTTAGARRLVEKGIELTVITSVTALNIDHLDEIYVIVSELGARKWQLQPLFPTGRGAADRALHLSDTDFLRMGRFARECADGWTAGKPKIMPADSCGYYSKFDVCDTPWIGCSAGRSSLGIMSDGRVKGCLSWPDSTVEGDLRKDDLWTIWFRPSAFGHLRTYSERDVHGPCQGCEMALECGGGCQAMSLAATGEWHSDPYCYRRLLQIAPADMAAT